MRGCVTLVGVFVAGLGFASAAVAGETVEEVGQKIQEASKNLKSFSAKIKTVTEMNHQGFSMKSTMDGTTEMLRKADVLMTRTESTGITETKVGDNSTRQGTSSLVITDGSFSYTLSDMAGTKTAFKSRIPPDAGPLASWKNHYRLTVLPDETVDGRAVWVIEATPTNTQAMQGKTVMYYDKASGQLIKMVAYAPDGKPLTTTTYSDIKINESIAADRFVFKAPPGVEVREM